MMCIFAIVGLILFVVGFRLGYVGFGCKNINECCGDCRGCGYCEDDEEWYTDWNKLEREVDIEERDNW